MTMTPTVICVSHNQKPGWRWIEHAMPRARFHCFDCQPQNALEKRVQKPLVARYRAAAEAAHAARKYRAPVLVSHLPLMTAWAQAGLSAVNAPTTHLAFAFNFTNLPHGRRQKLMAKAFRNVHRFAVPSSIERRLYSSHFDLPEDRIDVQLWGVRKPEVPSDMPPVIEGDYLCAVGGEGRDYRTLMEAMERLPHIHLVAVVRPHSLEGVQVPANVTVLVNAPLAQAHNVVAHARASVVPLRDSEVPCGHVTLVGAMYLRTPLVVTDSEGVHDYVRHEDNALLAPPRDAAALAQCIERAWEDRALCDGMVDRAEAFAHTHCTEQATVDYFDRYLNQIGL